jgi:TolB-like protein/Tfp pilus assembly protein PilF
MAIWTSEIKELEKLYESFKGQLPDLDKELGRLVKADDENMILLYSRRCLEVIITDLCECELKRPRKTEPLKGIIDKLHKEEKVPSNIITSMDHLNSLSAYGAHPKDFDPEQVKPVLNNLSTIIKWYLKYKEPRTDAKTKSSEETRQEIKSTENVKKDITISRKRLAGILGGLIGIIASVFAVLYFSNIIGSGKQIKESEKSIAVLPFKSLSDDPKNQYLADGMMDAILLHLSKIKDLKVLPRTSVEQYRGTTKAAHDIGQELDVEYLLEGSFQKFDDNARLIVQLIKANEESHKWANEYNSKWSEVFSMQSEVAQTIAKELYASITPEEKELIEKIPTGNIAAYNLYLKANNYLKEYEKIRELSSYNTAVNLYKSALEIDSTYAKAYTGLANAYFDRYQWETYFKENYLDSMRVLANKALSIDDQLDEAYNLKGRYYTLTSDHDKALENFDKALEFNPNNYLAYLSKGTIFSYYRGDYVKGIDNYHKALTLVRGNERPSILRALGSRYLEVGFIDKAKYYYQGALDLNRDSADYLKNLAWAEFSLENFEKALNLAKKENEINSTSLSDLIIYIVPLGHDEEAYIHANKLIKHFEKSGELNLLQSYLIGYAFWQVGKYEEAKKYFDQQIKYSEESIKLKRNVEQWKAAYYDLAATYAFLGNKEKAYKYLDEFNTMNFFNLFWISLTKHNPFMASISNEVRYQKILQNMEAEYQAEHERVRKWLEEKGML